MANWYTALPTEGGGVRGVAKALWRLPSMCQSYARAPLNNDPRAQPSVSVPTVGDCASVCKPELRCHY